MAKFNFPKLTMSDEKTMTEPKSIVKLKHSERKSEHTLSPTTNCTCTKFDFNLNMGN